MSNQAEEPGHAVGYADERSTLTTRVAHEEIVVSRLLHTLRVCFEFGDLAIASDHA